MIVTVTGKSGSGKTTVARILRSAIKGSRIIDADRIGRSILGENSVRGKLKSVFGHDVFTKGRISRKKLADIVFSDRQKLRKLNAISHPVIRKNIKDQIRKAKVSIIDAALTRELGLLRLSDVIIVVKSRQGQARRRIGAARFKRRVFQSEPSKPNFMLHNNSTLADLRQKVIKLAGKLG